MKKRARRKGTAFDGYVRERMKDAAFAEEYRRARVEIREIDRLVRSLDACRVAAELPKAELARRIRARPELIRRLFTADSPNPTLATLVKLADALDLKIELVPKHEVG